MGVQSSYITTSSQSLSIPSDCKLYSILPINSFQQQQQMLQILQRRMKISQCPYLCTVKGYDFINEDNNNNFITCGQSKKLVVYYDKFEYRLNDISIKNYNKYFNEQQLCNIVKSVVSALLYLREQRLHHGDISLEHIVKNCENNNNNLSNNYGNPNLNMYKYRLVDKIFIKNGINAYQKVLQGQPGFISPKQMIKIRYGFVKQSPQITQLDDIFSLGMVLLQLASQVPSTLCYKQMNVRFNQDILSNNINRVKQKYSRQFGELVEKMLQIQEDQRIELNQIAQHGLVKVRYHRGSGNGGNFGKLRYADINTVSNGNNNTKSNISLSKNNNLQNSQARKPITPTATSNNTTNCHNSPNSYKIINTNQPHNPTFPIPISVNQQNIKQTSPLATNNSSSFLLSHVSNSNSHNNMQQRIQIGRNLNLNNNINEKGNVSNRLGSDRNKQIINYDTNNPYNSGRHMLDNSNPTNRNHQTPINPNPSQANPLTNYQQFQPKQSQVFSNTSNSFINTNHTINNLNNINNTNSINNYNNNYLYTNKNNNKNININIINNNNKMYKQSQYSNK